MLEPPPLGQACDFVILVLNIFLEAKMYTQIGNAYLCEEIVTDLLTNPGIIS